MAVQFDYTVGGADSTTFASLSDASQYFENVSSAKLAKWNLLDEDDQKRALNASTLYIVNNYHWGTGLPCTDTQKLPWPRYDAYNKNGYLIDYTVIPSEVIAATCEIALLQFDFSGDAPVAYELVPETGRATKREKLDGVGEVEYADNAGVSTRKFPAVDIILSSLISGGGASGLTVNLRRA